MTSNIGTRQLKEFEKESDLPRSVLMTKNSRSVITKALNKSLRPIHQSFGRNNNFRPTRSGCTDPDY